MKTCQVCGAIAVTEAATCVCCGEASWIASPFTIEPDVLMPATEPAPVDPSAPVLAVQDGASRRRPK